MLDQVKISTRVRVESCFENLVIVVLREAEIRG
jgi:hypothetical protein